MGRRRLRPDPDLGSVYGRWTITGPSDLIDGQRMVQVQCACGTAGYRLLANLTSGKSLSCGCTSKVALPEVGSTHGEWTILAYDGPYNVVVRCSCGVEGRRYVYTIGRDSVSCGHPVESGYLERHGKSGRGRGNSGRSRAKLKATHKRIVRRCTDPSDIGWADYGGRGIAVCPEWNDERCFADWCLANGYVLGGGLHLDRIDNNGGYSPGNCRWVTPTENARNKRNTRWVTAFGETKSAAAWAEDARCCVRYATLTDRISRGVDPEDALTRPSRLR